MIHSGAEALPGKGAKDSSPVVSAFTGVVWVVIFWPAASRVNVWHYAAAPRDASRWLVSVWASLRAMTVTTVAALSAAETEVPAAYVLSSGTWELLCANTLQAAGVKTAVLSSSLDSIMPWSICADGTTVRGWPCASRKVEIRPVRSALETAVQQRGHYLFFAGDGARVAPPTAVACPDAC